MTEFSLYDCCSYIMTIPNDYLNVRNLEYNESLSSKHSNPLTHFSCRFVVRREYFVYLVIPIQHSTQVSRVALETCAVISNFLQDSHKLMWPHRDVWGSVRLITGLYRFHSTQVRLCGYLGVPCKYSWAHAGFMRLRQSFVDTPGFCASSHRPLVNVTQDSCG